MGKQRKRYWPNVYTERVGGSSPSPPTSKDKHLAIRLKPCARGLSLLSFHINNSAQPVNDIDEINLGRDHGTNVFVRGRRFVYYIDIFSALDVRGCRDMICEGDLLFCFRAGHPSPGAVRARAKRV